MDGPGRQLGLFAATALVMGNMIGSGVFLLPASLAPFGWNGVIGWVVTIAGSLVLAWLLAKLTVALPEAGGPSGFVEAAFGPVPSFLIGWIYLVSIWTAVVTIAVAAVSYASSLWPALGASPARAALIAVALVWLMTLVSLRGAGAAGRMQVATLLLKIVPLVAVIVLAVMAGGTAQIRPFDASAIDLAAINGAGALTLWALVGFEAASVAAAKVRNPAVTIPRATLWGTGLTGVLYLFVCSAIALMLPADVAANSPAPFATFVERYWAPGPAAAVALFAVISCVGALNGWVLVQGELPRAMAERGQLPRWLSVTDGRDTPVRALVASAVLASVFVLANLGEGLKAMFEYLLLLSTSATLWLYLVCALAALRLNIARAAGSVGAVYAVWALWGAGPVASGLSLVLMLSGLPVLWWTRRRLRTSQISA